MDKKLCSYFKELTERQLENLYGDLYGDFSSMITIADVNRLLANIPQKYSKVKDFLEYYFMNEHVYSAEEFYAIVTSLNDKNLVSNLELEYFRLIKEVLCYLGYQEATQLDEKILDEIKRNFSINCNIIQVGCGKLPNLAERIRQEQKGKGQIEVYDPSVINLYDTYSNLIKHDTFLWDIPLGTDLVIANDVCPNDQLFIELTAKNKDVGLFMKPCSNAHDIYYPSKDKAEKLVVGDFCQAMIDMYGKYGLECEEKDGNYTLIKRK